MIFFALRFRLILVRWKNNKRVAIFCHNARGKRKVDSYTPEWNARNCKCVQRFCCFCAVWHNTKFWKRSETEKKEISKKRLNEQMDGRKTRRFCNHIAGQMRFVAAAPEAQCSSRSKQRGWDESAIARNSKSKVKLRLIGPRDGNRAIETPSKERIEDIEGAMCPASIAQCAGKRV